MSGKFGLPQLPPVPASVYDKLNIVTNTAMTQATALGTEGKAVACESAKNYIAQNCIQTGGRRRKGSRKSRKSRSRKSKRMSVLAGGKRRRKSKRSRKSRK